MTGSAAWTSVIYALNQLPSIIIQPFAGVMVEGMRKKHVMVLSDLVRGGVIIGVFGVGAAMLVDAVTFFASAVLTGLVQVKEEKLERKHWDKQGYVNDLKEGFSYIKMKKVVMNFCLLAVVINMITVPISSLQTPMTVEIFGLGSELLSVYGITFVLGMSVGSLVLPYAMEDLPLDSIPMARCCLHICCVEVWQFFWELHSAGYPELSIFSL